MQKRPFLPSEGESPASSVASARCASVTTLPVRPVHGAELLLAEHLAGTWTPTAAERELAEGLAFTGLSASTLRTALRQALPGRLTAALAPVTVAMEQTPPGLSPTDLLPVRRLLDATAPPP